jgi:hypothetical protein
VEHRVLDDYERNRTLIDLTAQPDDIKSKIDESIIAKLKKSHISNVGIYFLKFCGKYELEKLSEAANRYAFWLNKFYSGVHK